MTPRRRAMAAIVAAGSADDILDAVETFAAETLSPDETWVLQSDDTGPARRRGRSPGPEPFSAVMRERVRSIEEPCVIGDTSDRRRTLSDPGDAQLGLPPYRSMAFVPMGDVGTVVVGADEPGAFAEDDLDSLTHIAELAGVAVAQLEISTNQLDEIRSTLSHDMVQPIAIARGNLDVVLQGEDLDRLDTVDAALERISQLTHELETLAATGHRTNHTDEVDVGTVARLAWELCEEPGTYLEVEADRSVEADRNALCHLFENLFRNAIEHGAETITVHGRGGTVYVDDDGPGIPADVRARVFDRGFSTKEAHTGEGLSIVSDIVQSHGWDIAAAENAAGGARFEIAVG